MTSANPVDPDWLAAVARAEVREGRAMVVCGGRTRSFELFAIAGFPCSGMDWVGRLLSLHPAIVVADTPRRLGPLGGTKGSDVASERERARKVALEASLIVAASKPDATHLGVVVVSGDASSFDPEVRVLRDGRDVLVAWTLRQLRENGAAAQRFLAGDSAASQGQAAALLELQRRLAADADEILVRDPGALLADDAWVRYGSYLWSEDVTGHFGAVGAIEEGKLGGAVPLALTFEEARAKPLAALNEVVASLGLPRLPALVERLAEDEEDPLLRSEWKIGRWMRFFTPRATKLFKLEASDALQSVTKNYEPDFDEWEGECPPSRGV